MKIVFFGTSAFGLPSLEAISQSSHSLQAVVSTPDKPRGRQLRVQPSPIKEWALERGITYFDYFKESPSEALQQIQDLDADVFVVISFGVILKKEALAIPLRMPVNIHASLLPQYRGASPMQEAILNRDGKTGVTAMRMVERLDAGDMLVKKTIPLGLQDDIISLEKRLSILAAEVTLETLELLEKDRLAPIPQNEKEASYTQKISKADGKISWNESADILDAKVRAYLGWPGTYFFFRGKRILICKAQTQSVQMSVMPGTILQASEKEGIVVAAAENTALRLEALQLGGRKTLGWKEFLRGFPLEAGEVLE